MTDITENMNISDNNNNNTNNIVWYIIGIVFILLVCFFIYLFQSVMNTWWKKFIVSIIVILFFSGIFLLVKKFDPREIVSLLNVSMSFYLPLCIIILMMIFTMSTSNIQNNKTELGINITLFLIFIFTLAYLFSDTLKLTWKSNKEEHAQETNRTPATDTFDFFQELNNLLMNFFPASETFQFFELFASKLQKNNTNTNGTRNVFLEDMNNKMKTPIMLLGYFFSFLYFLLSVFLPSQYSGSFKSTTQVLLLVFSLLLFLYTLLFLNTPNAWMGNVILMVTIWLITFIYFFPLWFLKNSLYIFIFFVAIILLVGICHFLFNFEFTALFKNGVDFFSNFISQIREHGFTYVYNYIVSFDRLPVFILLLICFLIFLFTGLHTETTSITKKIFDCVWQLLVIIIFAYLVSFLSIQNEQDVIVTSAFWHAKYMIFYVIFLILFFNIIEKDVLNKYGFIWVPSLICLGASVFYTSLHKVSSSSNSPNTMKSSNLFPFFKKQIKKQIRQPMKNPFPKTKNLLPNLKKQINKQLQPTTPLMKKTTKLRQQGGNSDLNKALLSKFLIDLKNENKNENENESKGTNKNKPTTKKNDNLLNKLLIEQLLPGKLDEIDKRTISNFQLKLGYERLKSIILFFCLITSMLIFYVVDPAGYFSKYLGSNFIYTILIGIFIFIFMTILTTYPRNKEKKIENTERKKEEFNKYGFKEIKKTSYEHKISNPQTVSTSSNLLEMFDSTTVISTVLLFIFIITVTIKVTTYKDGFFKSNSFSGIIIIVIILIVLLWGTVLGMTLFDTSKDSILQKKLENKMKKTETKEEAAAASTEKQKLLKKEKENIDKSILYRKQWNVGLFLSGGFCLIFFIIFLVKFFSDVSTTANIYQLIFNLMFILIYGMLCLKNILPEMNLPFLSNYRLGTTSLIIIGLILFSTILSRLTGSSFPLKLFCIMGFTIGTAIYFGIQSILVYVFFSCFSVWIAYLLGFLNELKFLPWYLQAGGFSIVFLYIYLYLLQITNSSIYIHLIFFLLAIMLLYFFLPTIQEKITLGNTGKQYIANPIALNKRVYIANYEELNNTSSLSSSSSTVISPTTTYSYNFAFSFWFYIDADTPNSMDYFSLFDFGGKPGVFFKLNDTSLKITVHTGADLDAEKNIIIFTTKAILLQKWNHLFLNVEGGGTMDIFLNGELVRSTAGIVPYLSQDALYIGEDNGISGNICNLIYFTQPQSITNILYLYNSMRFTTPPVPKEYNEIVDVNDLDQGEKIVRYS